MISGDTRPRELEARLRPFVARRVSPSDVDDVLQDIFLRMQRGLSALRDDERFAPWVYRVARSAIADQRRAQARHPVLEGEAPDAPALSEDDRDGDGDGDGDAIERSLARFIVPLVATLAPLYRDAITLTELEGLPQKDAAARLKIPLSTLKSRVQRGRMHLRDLLDACCAIALDARGHVIACEPRGGRCACT